jgi:chromosome segregation ATPase
MDDVGISAERWYVRTPDGTVYGPASLLTLSLWAADARVVPGCEVSPWDTDSWRPAESVPELRMLWFLETAAGTVYGPLNLLAVADLLARAPELAGAHVRQGDAAETRLLDGTLLPTVVEEAHRLLASAAAELAGALPATAAVELEALGQRVLELEAGASETARQQAAAEAQARAAEERAQQAEARAATAEERLQGVEAERQRLADEAAAADDRRRTSAVEGEESLHDLRRRLAEAESRLRERDADTSAAAREWQGRLEQAESAHAEDRRAAAEALARESDRAQALQAQAEQADQVAAAARQHAEEQGRILAEREREIEALRRQAAERDAALTARVAEAERRAEADQQRAQTLSRQIQQERAAHAELQATWVADVNAGRARVAELERALAHVQRTLQSEAAAVKERDARLQSMREALLQKEEALRTLKAGCEAQIQEARDAATRDRAAAAELQARWLEQEAGLTRQVEELRRGARLTEHIIAQKDAAIRERDERLRQIPEQLGEDERLRRQVADLEAERRTLLDQAAGTERRLEEEQRNAQAFRERAQTTEKDLAGRIADLRTELAAAIAALDEKEQGVRGTGPEPVSAIDWVNPEQKRVGNVILGITGTTSGRALLHIVEQLQGELGRATAIAQRTEQELDEYKRLYNALKGQSARTDSELQGRLETLKREVQASESVLDQAMIEIERRESSLRALRRQAEQREKELAAQVADLQTKAAGGAAAGTAPGAPPPEVEPETAPDTEGVEPPPPPGMRVVLKGLEAKAQAELESWQRMKPEEKPQGEKPRPWFRRKRA